MCDYEKWTATCNEAQPRSVMQSASYKPVRIGDLGPTPPPSPTLPPSPRSRVRVSCGALALSSRDSHNLTAIAAKGIRCSVL